MHNNFITSRLSFYKKKFHCCYNWQGVIKYYLFLFLKIKFSPRSTAQISMLKIEFFFLEGVSFLFSYYIPLHILLPFSILIHLWRCMNVQGNFLWFFSNFYRKLRVCVLFFLQCLLRFKSISSIFMAQESISDMAVVWIFDIGIFSLLMGPIRVQRFLYLSLLAKCAIMCRVETWF